MKEKTKQEILKSIFEHYWWNIRGFGYRCNNDENLEREMLALALEPYLENNIRKPQSKIKVDMRFKEQSSGEVTK